MSIALLVSLCVMGVGYAVWMDAASIDGTVETGYIGVELSVLWHCDHDCARSGKLHLRGHPLICPVEPV
jgi:hypothetical protein